MLASLALPWLVVLGLWAQTAQPTQATPEPTLTIDLALAAHGNERLLVLVTLTNRSAIEPLTSVAIRAGSGASGEVTRAVADLEPGQSRAEQLEIVGATSAYTVVSYTKSGRSDSVARSVALAPAPPDALISPLLAGGFGILGLILGQLGSYLLGSWRARDEDRHTWFTDNAEHLRNFVNSWNLQTEVEPLRREYNTLKGRMRVPLRIRAAYDKADQAFASGATAEEKLLAAKELQDEIDRLFARFGTPLDN